MDLSTMADDDLDVLRVAVLTEIERRRTITDAPTQAAALADRYAAAIGRQDGDQWQQPTGAHDAYPLGATVTRNGKTWQALTASCVWEPGVSGWREVVAEGYPAWVQPTGAHDAYPLGATVTHGGKTWQSLTPANVWQPGVSGWREVVAEGYPAWVQPTGAHDAYAKGARVSFKGSDYESLIGGNVWSTTGYPAGWLKL